MKKNQNVRVISAIALSLALLTGCGTSNAVPPETSANSTEEISKPSTTTASTTLSPQTVVTTADESDDGVDSFIEFDNIQDYNDYLAVLDRTNEVVVMTDDEFADFISTTYPTAQGITILFMLGSTFMVDTDMPVYKDPQGNVYEPFLTDSCHSLDDLWTYISDFYVDEVVDEFKDSTIEDGGHIIEMDGILYSRQGAKGTTTVTYPEQAELVYQQEDKITYTLPVSYGGEETQSFRLCTLSKDGGVWKYDRYAQ